MKWIEIHVSRILEIAVADLHEFELIDDNGEYLSLYAAYSFYMARRKKDGRLFRRATVRPHNAESSMFYLEEV
jgi:hypothetical protein